MKIYLYTTIMISILTSCHQAQRDDSQTNAFIAKNTRIWPYGVVPYSYEKEIHSSTKSIFEEAIADVHHKTNIRFMPLDEAKREGFRRHNWKYLKVGTLSPDSPLGWADVGMGNIVKIELGLRKDATLANAKHELMHVLGFEHEHIARGSLINYNVVKSSSMRAFAQAPRGKQPKYDFDPHSITMYNSLTVSSICFLTENEKPDKKWNNPNLQTELPPESCILRGKNGTATNPPAGWKESCAKKCATHLDPDGELITGSFDFSQGDIQAINDLYKEEVRKRSEVKPMRHKLLGFLKRLNPLSSPKKK